ncbi:MAG: hypothetical protein P0Y49_06590 [Candidatus Pedobacter colombiensis]|uniref:DUF1349 domain-containing protein n=1 Tax=Candidatus Pedobacter colombiensis TaxID=3121371 RepID=A0AAJ5WBV1_9SPHI|nr:hypothetical protein [Pedobacter sp.]WEK20801.1 MAG: hypothetical protein P0Y49_06590 [Pedobacter sp.]
MKTKLFLFFLLCHTAIYAQPFIFPALPTYGKSLESLIPSNWKVIDSVSGDLNNDNVKDIAFVLEFYRPVKENRAYGDNDTEIITEVQKPRMLAIYFKKSIGGNYRLATQNNNFILRSEEGGVMGDPLRPMRIENNQLVLSFEGGGNWRWKLNYAFKYLDKDWQLVQANNYAYHDSSGEMNDKQYDFVNKTRKVVSGKMNENASANDTFEQPLTIKTLRTFNNFKKPWTWEINKDEFL